MDCRNLAEEKVVLHSSLWDAFSSEHIFASRRRQTSAVSVPFIFIESAMRVWWRGRVEMDHRGRIDEIEENYHSFKTRFIKANGNLGSKYIFPAFTHDSTVMTWHFWLWMLWSNHKVEGEERRSTLDTRSLESNPEPSCSEIPGHYTLAYYTKNTMNVSGGTASLSSIYCGCKTYSVQICLADYSGHPVTLISTPIICTSFQNELCNEAGGAAQCVSDHRQTAAAAQASCKRHMNTALQVRGLVFSVVSHIPTFTV